MATANVLLLQVYPSLQVLLCRANGVFEFQAKARLASLDDCARATGGLRLVGRLRRGAIVTRVDQGIGCKQAFIVGHAVQLAELDHACGPSLACTLLHAPRGILLFRPHRRLLLLKRDFTLLSLDLRRLRRCGTHLRVLRSNLWRNFMFFIIRLSTLVVFLQNWDCGRLHVCTYTGVCV